MEKGTGNNRTVTWRRVCVSGVTVRDIVLLSKSGGGGRGRGLNKGTNYHKFKGPCICPQFLAFCTTVATTFVLKSWLF